MDAKLSAIEKQLKKLDKLEEVSKKLDKLDSKFGNLDLKLNKLEKDVADNRDYCVGRLDNLEKSVDNRFASLQRAHEIVVSGIPDDCEKSADDIYDLISSFLGYGTSSESAEISESPEPSPAAKVFRLPSRNSIIFRFASIFDKDDFFHRYLGVAKTMTHRELKLSNDKKKRVYLQQNLPQSSYKIFKTAMSHVKSGALNKVNISSYGDIMIRVQQKDRFICIRNGSDLQTVLANKKKK